MKKQSTRTCDLLFLIPLNNNYKGGSFMRFNQVATASIWLGIHMPGTACRAYISFSKIRIKSEVTKPPSLAGFAAITYIQKNRVTITVNQRFHIARPNRQTERAFSIKHAFLSPPIQGITAFLTQKKK